MSRMPRIVVPGVPYHIFSRGNHKADVFFQNSDKRLYLKLLDEYGEKFGVAYLAYCIMDNHLHLNAVPQNETSLSKCFAEVNRRYTYIINTSKGWTGNLWEGRFHSFPMDETYLFNCIRYAENNPVKAKLVERARDYSWSSAAEHMTKKQNPFLKLADIHGYLDIPDWAAYLDADVDPSLEKKIETHSRTGRPLGSEEFVSELERLTGRKLVPGRPGRKKKFRFSCG
jgi:putative transposase